MMNTQKSDEYVIMKLVNGSWEWFNDYGDDLKHAKGRMVWLRHAFPVRKYKLVRYVKEITITEID